MTERAVVLGGGGVTGVAWEAGVLAGLVEAGVDLRSAEAVFGTSAGAFTGAALAAGHGLRALFDAQLAPAPAEVAATASKATLTAWYEAFVAGGTDPRRVGEEMGRIAREQPSAASAALRRAAVEARLVTRDWPPALRVTAIDADTGELRVFDERSGAPLVDAVTASGAVPGVWPAHVIGGRTYIDGGMVSTANAGLAQGCARVVVIAPLPDPLGPIPGATEDVKALAETASAVLVAPDADSMEAIGPNIYDPARRAAAARAGRAQAGRVAASVAAVWA